MSRTNRAYHEKMCMRRPQTTMERRQQAMLNELVVDDSLLEELGIAAITIGNRALTRHIANAYDDVTVAALDETKHLWKDN